MAASALTLAAAGRGPSPPLYTPHPLRPRPLHRQQPRPGVGRSPSPTFSAIVVDANSGRTIYAADPDGLRHPASITKVMTLYLLFEQLESGR